jgi:hypothetical protein
VVVLSEAIRQAVLDPGHQQKAQALGFQLRCLNTAFFLPMQFTVPVPDPVAVNPLPRIYHRMAYSGARDFHL